MTRDENSKSRRQIRYTLEELISQCKSELEPAKDDLEWLDAKPVGRELI